MTVEKDFVITIDYTLRDKDGEILDASEEAQPLSYIHGAGDIISGLEDALTGKSVGETLEVVVAAKDGYGEYEQKLVVPVPRANFEQELEISPGMQFEAETEDGSHIVTVIEVGDDTVTVDANHPLAGEDLYFTVTIRDIREATEEELKNGLEHCGCGCEDHCGGGCDCGCR